jgi:protease-4
MSNSLQVMADFLIKNQRHKRLWNNFFKLTWLIIISISLLFFIFNYQRQKSIFNKPHVALIKIEGVITSTSSANSEYINGSLTSAFKNTNTKAILLEINSPGGSPVQSDNIYQHIQFLTRKYLDTPLYAVCTDICASGGYYIASAAKSIYANRMTITGSIGVRIDGFGYADLLRNIGIERRVYVAGSNKNFLDSFQKNNLRHINEMQKMLDESHKVFIKAIKNTRGNRLNINDKESIFSGLPFLGIHAKEYGLIDGFSYPDAIVYDKFGDLPVINYTYRHPFSSSISAKLFNEILYQIRGIICSK